MTGVQTCALPIYFFVIISVLALGYIVISKGEFLQSKFFFIGNYSNDSINFFNHFNSTFQQNFHHPLAILLLQIITIIFTARTFGFLVNQIGQPTVIGEIFAGIFLGPSILGYWFPAYSNYLFPTESLANLEFLSQVGLVLFMFVIGMELDLKILRNQIRDSIDRKSTRLNSSHIPLSRMPSSA